MPLDSTFSALADAPDAAVRRCDVLVIGGGPAGATAAALLAERGRDVVMLEKARHPRFHIGESLLPLNLRVFDRLDLRDKVGEIGVYKPGATFVSDGHDGLTTSFEFKDGLNKDYTYSYHVRRDQFDALLFNTARERGALALEGMRVTEVRLDSKLGSRVVARDERGEEHHFLARFVVDASGRDTFMAQRLGSKQSNKRNNTAAIYGHFRNVAPRDGAQCDGHITIHLFEHGWFWAIPLPDGLTSIGVVSNPEFFRARSGDLASTFHQAVSMSPSLAARMQGAEPASAIQGTGNYSYKSTVMAGDGWMMVGDAFAFVDPIFSSGVILAMASAELGAEAVDVWLDDPKRAAPLLRAFQRKVKRAVGGLSWLIYRINRPVFRDMFIRPSNRFRMRQGVVSMLAGDVHNNVTRQMPVIAFKAAYYFLSAAYRLGFRHTGEGLVRIRS